MGNRKASIGLLLAILLAMTPAAFAMTSTNYALSPSDTNSGGGTRASSSYTMEMDMVGQGVTGGSLASTSYNLQSGLLLAMGGEPDIYADAGGSNNFGDIPVGNTSGPGAVRVDSIGSADLVLGTVYINGADAGEFNITNDGVSGNTIPPDDNAWIEFEFSPQSAGTKTANLVIPSNDPDTPEWVVPLSGNGLTVYQLSVSVTGTGFGNVLDYDWNIWCGDGMPPGYCSWNYPDGYEITLEAFPSPGSTFTGWSGAGSGCVSGAENPCSFNITTNTSITATFDSAGGPSADIDVYGMPVYNPIGQGEAFVLTMDVYNNGPDTASGVELTYALPTSWVYLDAWSSPQGSCSESGGTVTCTLGDITNASMVNIGIRVIPQVRGFIDTSVSVTTATADPNTSNNTYALDTLAVYPTRFADLDFDGDGAKDVVVYRASTGEWYFTDMYRTTPTKIQFGLPGDIPVPADYDGDGVTDVALFRPSTGEWFFTDKARTSPTKIQFGAAGDLPIPGSYDIDAAAEVAIYRPGTGEWYFTDKFRTSPTKIQFGLPGDIPVPADYAGAGYLSVALFRPSTGEWYFTDMTRTAPTKIQFGVPGDVLVPDNYDVDSQTEVAIYRPSTGEWYFTDMTRTSPTKIQFGMPGGGDRLVPGDYNNSGESNVAIFRPWTGEWYFTDKARTAPTKIQFGGVGGDYPY